MTIAGVKRLIKDTGIKQIMALGEKAKNDTMEQEGKNEGRKG